MIVFNIVIGNLLFFQSRQANEAEIRGANEAYVKAIGFSDLIETEVSVFCVSFCEELEKNNLLFVYQQETIDTDEVSFNLVDAVSTENLEQIYQLMIHDRYRKGNLTLDPVQDRQKMIEEIVTELCRGMKQSQVVYKSEELTNQADELIIPSPFELAEDKDKVNLQARKIAMSNTIAADIGKTLLKSTFFYEEIESGDLIEWYFDWRNEGECKPMRTSVRVILKPVKDTDQETSGGLLNA